MKNAVISNEFDSSDSDDTTYVEKPQPNSNRLSLKESAEYKKYNLMRKRAELYNL